MNASPQDNSGSTTGQYSNRRWKEAMSRKKQEEAGEVDLKKFMYTLWTSKWTIIGSLISGALLALLVAVLMTPIYEGQGTMIFKQAQQGGSLMNMLGGGNSGISSLVSSSFGIGGGVNLANEQEVLESRTLFNAMADELLADPIMSDGRMYPVLWKEWPEDSVMIEKRDVAARLNKNISYELLSGTSIIEIVYESPSPLEAANMVNLAMETYKEVSKEQNIGLANSATEFLDEEEADIKDSLEVAEQNLEEFMDTNDIVALDAQTSHLIDQYAQLKSRQYEVEADLRAANAAIEEYEKRLNELKPGLAEKLANAIGPNIENLQYKISELKTQRALIYSNYPGISKQDTLPKKISNINNQIADLEERIREATDSLIASNEEYIGLLGASASSSVINTLSEYTQKLITLRVERLQYQALIEYLTEELQEQEVFLENLPENTIRFARLQRKVEVLEELYLTVSKQRAQMDMSAKAEMGNSRVLDESLIPEKPAQPNYLLFLLIGIFTAGFLSTAYVAMNTALGTTIWGTEYLIKLGHPILSVVPLAGQKEQRVVASRPGTNFSKAFQKLANGVMHADGNPRVLMVASSLEDEGKTTITGNLALALSKAGHNTLVIDADFKDSDIEYFFGQKSQHGLTDIVYGGGEPAAAILQTDFEGVDLLPCGKDASISQGVLQSSGFKNLLSTLREKYDYILFDTSAVSVSGDATDLAGVVDETILVAQFGKTKLPDLEHTLEELDNIKIPVLGIVLNKYNAAQANEYRFEAYKNQ